MLRLPCSPLQCKRYLGAGMGVGMPLTHHSDFNSNAKTLQGCYRSTG